MIVFVDEIEKAFAGTGTDMSGVKTEMTGTMLSWMEDRGADGLIFIGPAGAAKSAIGKAAGATAGIGLKSGGGLKAHPTTRLEHGRSLMPVISP